MTQIIEERIDEITIVSLNDRLDAFSAPDLRNYFAKLIEQSVKKFVIDLELISFLDSAGLAALVQLLKQAVEKGGGVRLILPLNQDVQRIFRLTKFDQVFEIHASVQDAVNSF